MSSFAVAQEEYAKKEIKPHTRDAIFQVIAMADREGLGISGIAIDPDQYKRLVAEINPEFTYGDEKYIRLATPYGYVLVKGSKNG